MVLKPESVPEGRRFKGYEEFTSRGTLCQAQNILYRRQRWLTPDGKTIVAPLPGSVKFVGKHIDVSVYRFVLYQYYQCHVPRPLILEHLLEIGLDISAGQVNHIIVEGPHCFHDEKDEILRVGLDVWAYVNVDDTGARHKGKNGDCTHIGNELFAWFESSQTKSRINFPGMLRGGNRDYVLNDTAFDYMEAHSIPKRQIELLKGCGRTVFENLEEWNTVLNSLGIDVAMYVRIITEAALLGSTLKHRFVNPKLVIVSDDAGQFNVLLHALCWIHAERSLLKLIPANVAHREALEGARSRLWDFYRCLHDNTSERDIRDIVKKRNISGSTRSDLGRPCRDTFASLKKTCRKLGVGFRDLLNDRLSGDSLIPWPPDLMRQPVIESPG